MLAASLAISWFIDPREVSKQHILS